MTLVQANYYHRTRLVTRIICKTCLFNHSTHLTTRITCSTSLFTRSTRCSTRSTRLSTRSACLSIHSTLLSTRSICLSTRSTPSAFCRSFYNWSKKQYKFGRVLSAVWVYFIVSATRRRTWTWESSSYYFNCPSWISKVELQLWWYKELIFFKF